MYPEKPTPDDPRYEEARRLRYSHVSDAELWGVKVQPPSSWLLGKQEELISLLSEAEWVFATEFESLDLSGLTPRQKVVVYLFYCCDYDMPSAAREMGCSLSNAYQIHRRALARLRRE
jgi:DNA-directed RNA polymerase specialized sigma24 family protein